MTSEKSCCKWPCRDKQIFSTYSPAYTCIQSDEFLRLCKVNLKYIANAMERQRTLLERERERESTIEFVQHLTSKKMNIS